MLIIVVPPYDSEWNLHGQGCDDTSKNVITPDGWYGFAAEVEAARHERERSRGNVARLLEEAGGYSDEY